MSVLLQSVLLKGLVCVCVCVCVDGVMKFHAKPWSQRAHTDSQKHTLIHTHCAASERGSWYIQNKEKTRKERPRAHRAFSSHRHQLNSINSFNQRRVVMLVLTSKFNQQHTIFFFVGGGGGFTCQI